MRSKKYSKMPPSIMMRRSNARLPPSEQGETERKKKTTQFFGEVLATNGEYTDRTISYTPVTYVLPNSRRKGYITLPSQPQDGKGHLMWSVFKTLPRPPCTA